MNGKPARLNIDACRPRSHTLFMNWFGNQPGEGIEFFILAGAMAVQVTIKGGEKWSLKGLPAGLQNVKINRL